MAPKRQELKCMQICTGPEGPRRPPWDPRGPEVLRGVPEGSRGLPWDPRENRMKAMEVSANAEMSVDTLDEVASQLEAVLEPAAAAIEGAVRQEGPMSAPQYSSLHQRWVSRGRR